MNIKAAATLVLSGALAVFPKIALADDFLVCAKHALEVNNPGSKVVVLGGEDNLVGASMREQDGVGLQARSGIIVRGDKAAFFIESKDKSVIVVRQIAIRPDNSSLTVTSFSQEGTSSAFDAMMNRVTENMETDFSACAARTGQNNTVKPSPFHIKLAEAAKARTDRSVELHRQAMADAVRAKRVIKGSKNWGLGIGK